MKSEFPPRIFQPEKKGMLFQTFRLLQEFCTETSKTARFIGSYIESCSGFMIHTRCHKSIGSSLAST